MRERTIPKFGKIREGEELTVYVAGLHEEVRKIKGKVKRLPFYGWYVKGICVYPSTNDVQPTERAAINVLLKRLNMRIGMWRANLDKCEEAKRNLEARLRKLKRK